MSKPKAQRRALRTITALGVVALAMVGWFGFRWLREQRYILWLESPAEAVREKAAAELAALRSARGARALATVLRRDTAEKFYSARRASRHYCFRALVEIGSPAVRPLIQLVRDDDVSVRRAAALALGKIGPAARGAVGELRAATADPDDFLRQTALQTLGALGPAAEPALLEIRRTLRHRDPITRTAAAWVLGEIGPAAREAIPELRLATRDRDMNVRAQAAWALGCMGPHARLAAPDLERALGDESRGVREKAAEALERIAGGGAQERQPR